MGLTYKDNQVDSSRLLGGQGRKSPLLTGCFQRHLQTHLSTLNLTGEATEGTRKGASCLAVLISPLGGSPGVRGREPPNSVQPREGRCPHGPKLGLRRSCQGLPAGCREPPRWPALSPAPTARLHAGGEQDSPEGLSRPTLAFLPHPAGAGIVLVPRAHAHGQHKGLPLPALGGLLRGSRSRSLSVPRLPDLLGRQLHTGLGGAPRGLPGALPAAAPTVLEPVLLLLLFLAHLLPNLQDDAGELIEVAEALHVRQLDAVHEVDVDGLLPSRDVGVTLRSERAAISRDTPLRVVSCLDHTSGPISTLQRSH